MLAAHRLHHPDNSTKSRPSTNFLSFLILCAKRSGNIISGRVAICVFLYRQKEKQFIWLPHNMRKGVNKMSHWNKSKKAFLLKCHCGQHSLVGHNSDFSFFHIIYLLSTCLCWIMFFCALILLDGMETQGSLYSYI